MTELTLRTMRRFPVTVGGITLLLSSCKTVGAMVLREQCTADHTAAVTASYPKGTRITLEGWLAPAQDVSAVIAALAARLSEESTEDVTVRGLCYRSARLCGYTLHETQEHTAVTLVLYTPLAPVCAEVEEA